LRSIKSLLEKPGLEFRPWAMWIWNSSITREKMIGQLNAFIEKGFGGVSVKPSRDMTPGFMSKEFFELFQEVLDIAQNAKIEVRLAEDFSMPWSGAFVVPSAEDVGFRAQYLHLEFTEIITDKKAFERTIANPETAVILAAKVQHGKISLSQIKRITVTADKPQVMWKPVTGDWQFMVFRISYVLDPVCGYIPNMFNAGVAQWYCTTVADAFRKKFLKYVPTVFKGFLYELPSYIVPSDGNIPWDEDMATKYQTKFKKKLTDILPALFFNVDVETAKIRTQTYNFIHQMAHERFTAVLEAWSKKNRMSQWILFPERSMLQKNFSGLKYCGAMPGDTITSPVGLQNADGSDENSTLLHAAADLNTLQYHRETITVIGRNRAGAGATLQQLKTEADRALFLGATKIILDGCFFNIDRRSYGKTPHTMFWYSPDWVHMNLLCNYIARLSEITAHHHFSRSIAVVRPVSSILADFNAGATDPQQQQQGTVLIQETIRELERINLGFDIISEELLSTCVLHASGDFVAGGKARRGNYQVLVVPYSRLIPSTVLGFIEKLIEKGGNVLFIGEPPQGLLEDGVTASFTSRMKKLMQSKKGNIVVATVKEIESVCCDIVPDAIVTMPGKRCDDIITQHAVVDTIDYYFFHNVSVRQDYFVSVDISEQKSLAIADCTSGELLELHDVERKNKRCCFGLTLLPGQTYVVTAAAQKQQVTVLGKGKKSLINTVDVQHRSYRVVLKEQWQFSPDTLNLLPLANMNARIGLSREFGSYSLFYEANFEVKDTPGVCFLTVGQLAGEAAYSRSLRTERPIEVTVNGAKVTELSTLQNIAGVPAYSANVLPSLFGSSTLLYDIKEHLRKGPNRVTFRTFGGVLDPMSMVYPPLIAGDFSIVKGVSGWVLSVAPSMAGHDSWTKSGYPYLSGAGTYKQIFELPGEFSRLILRMTQTTGSVDVGVNGKPVGMFNWHPMEIDITDACEMKRNEISLRVTNTLDNVLRMNGRASGIIGEAYVDVY
jgi:hypothetical protein